MDIKLIGGDLDLSTGDLVLIDGPESIAQHLRIRLRFFLGEWYLDQRVGIPYFQTIFLKGAKYDVIREIFRKAIVNTPGVIEVLNLELEYIDTERLLRVTFDARVVGADVPLSFTEEFII